MLSEKNAEMDILDYDDYRLNKLIESQTVRSEMARVLGEWFDHYYLKTRKSIILCA